MSVDFPAGSFERWDEAPDSEFYATPRLVTHIDDEEYALFPHIFHALDPEQWEQIELAHRAIETVWDEQPIATTAAVTDVATEPVLP